MERYRNEPMNTPEQKLRQELDAAYACIKDLAHRVSVEDFMSDTDQNIYNDVLEKHKEIISKARGEK